MLVRVPCQAPWAMIREQRQSQGMGQIMNQVWRSAHRTGRKMGTPSLTSDRAKALFGISTTVLNLRDLSCMGYSYHHNGHLAKTFDLCLYGVPRLEELGCNDVACANDHTRGKTL